MLDILSFAISLILFFFVVTLDSYGQKVTPRYKTENRLYSDTASETKAIAKSNYKRQRSSSSDYESVRLK